MVIKVENRTCVYVMSANKSREAKLDHVVIVSF